MKNSSKQIDRATLKTLEPLNRLNPILLDELAAKSVVDEVPADRIICRHGEPDSRQIYLLSGQIEVVTPGETKTRVLKARSPLTTPVAEGSPRSQTIKTKTASTLLYIDADLLELLMSDEPEVNTTYEVTEISADDNGDDWMLSFLQSPAFLKLPTDNIQKLLTHLEEIPAKKDQVVIKQGASDDNYYIIKSGSVNVHRQPYPGSASVLLATLPTGSGFGEEALISNGKRNATITMRENGSLMRLKKKDFMKLLIEPLIPYFAHSETQAKLNAGCVVIDVRTEQESKAKPLDGAVNIPLSMLRMKLDSLNADREYLLVCNDGSQSAAAAFLVIQHGLKCSVLEGGLDNTNKSINKINTPAKAANNPMPAADKPSKEVIAAKKQAEQIAAQQQQIKAAREKAEQDILKHKKQLAESRARINAEKEKQKKSAAAAEQARKQAEQEAARKKQQALEEAERLKAQKATQELAKAEAERKAIEQRQKESNEAMRKAEEMMKQSAIAAEKAKKEAELEAERIKQRALEEAEYLKAEVEAARKKMEQDAARLKQEEKIIKTSALKIKNEADEIRRTALNEAQQIRAEIESTRAKLEQKLQQTKVEEKRKHDAIIAEAKKQADKLAASKTKEAAAEAEAIRLQAKKDAERLHNELEQTRQQIEAEANRVINGLKEQSKKSVTTEQDVKVIHEETVVEVVSESERLLNTKPHEEQVNYKSVSIPGMSPVEPISDIDAQRKAKAIKAKLEQSREEQVEIHKNNDKTILESDDDLFIFKEPDVASKTTAPVVKDTPVVSQRTQAEASLTQIETKPVEEEALKSVVIYPERDRGPTYKNNPFLNQDGTPAANESSASTTAAFDQQAYARRKQGGKSNTFAIAASFILILAGAVFTLHATNTLKVQSIAALFNSGNDSVKPETAIVKAKPIRKKVLQADTKVDIKKKVGNKMDNIMQNWQEVLNEAENPKKAKQ